MWLAKLKPMTMILRFVLVGFSLVYLCVLIFCVKTRKRGGGLPAGARQPLKSNCFFRLVVGYTKVIVVCCFVDVVVVVAVVFVAFVAVLCLLGIVICKILQFLHAELDLCGSVHIYSRCPNRPPFTSILGGVDVCNLLVIQC